ncbi:hypothetical protein [Alkalicoccobacillus murimartini]|uniref:DUF2383 domain-containing protein n=1 Tax=Alkalicoccobacillus murimartini TaxID=171685 RepID=A0ABT9YJR6_9BACI|nr:hypothetical protein [Alkalicoccobacillus murimartini]MDQ0207853.1 hypothetical protein [Alkalicoccobacillus murimartini]
MKEILSELHDLLTTLRKDSKTYIKLLEPRLTNPNNDFERMLIRKALGSEKNRIISLKVLRNQIKEWIGEEPYKNPSTIACVQLYADSHVEHVQLQSFIAHLDEAIILLADSQRDELNDLYTRSQANQDELQALISKLKSFMTDETQDEIQPTHSDENEIRTFSVGSLLE